MTAYSYMIVITYMIMDIVFIASLISIPIFWIGKKHDALQILVPLIFLSYIYIRSGHYWFTIIVSHYVNPDIIFWGY